MNRSKKENYFVFAFLTLLVAVVSFVVFKGVLPKRLFPDNLMISDKIVIDSLAIAAIKNDTVRLTDTAHIISKNDSIRYKFSSNKNMEGHAYIINFYEELHKLENSDVKTKKVRVAYFGDSMTDGDLIVQDIRREFQRKYGGSGVGFVGITSQSAKSRYSVTHKYSVDWKTVSFLKKINSDCLLGVDGQVSYCFDFRPATLEYQANSFDLCEHLHNPILYYGKCLDSKAYVKVYVGNDSVLNITLGGDKILNTVQLAKGNLKNLKLEFHASDSVPFYGVDLAGDKGVVIDNLSMRGNSGLPLSILDVGLMQKFDETLSYDLIILQYGANVLGYETSSFSWYEKKMAGVIEHLRKCFPNAEILLVSVADKASKIDMEMKTDPAVLSLLKAQKSCAEKAGVGFINLYNLMGGDGTMVEWVEGNPALANKDYTHFNTAGSKKIASLIFGEIEKGYSNYKRLKNFND